MYTISELANLSGVTSRTLRHYDQIGLLTPNRNMESNYRLYTSKEVDLLQQILLYKELGFELKEIKNILFIDQFNQLESFRFHLKKLTEYKNRYEALIEQVNKSIQSIERNTEMNDTAKFEHLKKEMIEENDQQYGSEVQETWGKDIYKKSQQKVAKMTKAELERTEFLQSEIIRLLLEGYHQNDETCSSAQKACEYHKEWIMYYWPHYTKETHQDLVDMYLEDERFKSYYDKHQEGLALFLNKAMHFYLTHSK